MTLSLVPTLDLAIGRGDDAPALSWAMGFAVAGSDFELVITSPSAQPVTSGLPVPAPTVLMLTASGGDLALDTTANTVSWPATSAESEALPYASTYTLRRVVPEVRYYAAGRIFGLDGPVGPSSVTVASDGAQGATPSVDLAIGRGDTAPAPQWAFSFDITGSDFELDVAGGVYTVSGGGLALDVASGTVSWPATSAQTAALANVNDYTLRRVSPERRYYAAGRILGVDGPVRAATVAVQVQGPQGIQGLTGEAGPEGATGPAGPPGSTPTIYQIMNVASYTAYHGLAFAPQALIVDGTGAVVDTDTLYAPGQVTLVFAQPFTGTLYLGG